MASKVAIANAALGKFGGATIGNLNEEQSETAKRVRNRWDTLRDGLLADHPWNFNSKLAQPAKLPTAPAFGFAAAYRKPIDCWRVWSVNSDRYGRYVIRGDEIHYGTGSGSAGSTIDLVYLAKVEDTEKWSPWFTEAFIAALACELAPAVAELSAAKMEQLEKTAQRKLREARSTDGQEGMIDPEPDSDWLAARR